jgi:hypothetical protein
VIHTRILHLGIHELAKYAHSLVYYNKVNERVKMQIEEEEEVEANITRAAWETF